MPRKMITITCQVKVPFESYGSLKKDGRVRRDITSWIRDTLLNHCSYIPIYVEVGGETVEDSSHKARVRVTGKLE